MVTAIEGVSCVTDHARPRQSLLPVAHNPLGDMAEWREAELRNGCLSLLLSICLSPRNLIFFVNRTYWQLYLAGFFGGIRQMMNQK